MAALKTVSMTPESCDWKVAIVSAITLMKNYFQKVFLKKKTRTLEQPLYTKRLLACLVITCNATDWQKK